MLKTSCTRFLKACSTSALTGAIFSSARGFAQSPAALDFEAAHVEPARAEASKMFQDLGMPLPEALKGQRPLPEVLDAVSAVFMEELDLPADKMKEAYVLRMKIKEALQKQQQEILPEPVNIDWEGLKVSLEDAELVDKFKAAMDKTLADPAVQSPAMPEGPDPLMEAMAEAQKNMEQLSKAVQEDAVRAEAKLKELKARSKEIEQDIAAIESGNITIDSELAKHPGIASKIDQEILDDKW